MLEKKKRNIIIFTLCTVLLLMTIGYAAFNTFLNINGTTSITSNWDIRITNITSKAKEGDAYDIEEPSHTDLEATFKTGLKSPGDSITYDITVENKGTFNAYLEKITINKKDNPAIIFESSGLKENDELAPDTSKILTIKVTYNPDITEDPEDKSADFTVELDFGQDIFAKETVTWKCPNSYSSKDEPGPDMNCTKETSGTVITTCPSGCSVSGKSCTGTVKSQPVCLVGYVMALGIGWTCCNPSSPFGETQMACNHPQAYGVVTSQTYNWSCGGYSVVSPCGYCQLNCSDVTPTFSCQSGYTPNGSGSSMTCIKTETAKPEQVTTYTCPDGYRLEDKKCYKE